MSRRAFRLLAGLGLILACGMLQQTGCFAFAGDQVFRTVDFCFIFDCQNGAFAGLLDPCPDQGLADDDPNAQNLFLDCPTDAGGL